MDAFNRTIGWKFSPVLENMFAFLFAFLILTLINAQPTAQYGGFMTIDNGVVELKWFDNTLLDRFYLTLFSFLELSGW